MSTRPTRNNERQVWLVILNWRDPMNEIITASNAHGDWKFYVVIVRTSQNGLMECFNVPKSTVPFVTRTFTA